MMRRYQRSVYKDAQIALITINILTAFIFDYANIAMHVYVYLSDLLKITAWVLPNGISLCKSVYQHS